MGVHNVRRIPKLRASLLGTSSFPPTTMLTGHARGKPIRRPRSRYLSPKKVFFSFSFFFFLIVQSINPRFKAVVSSLTTFLFAPFHSFQSIPHLLSFTSVLENCIILDDLKIGFLLLFSFPFFLIYSYYFGQFFNGAFSFSSPIYLHSFQFLSLL